MNFDTKTLSVIGWRKMRCGGCESSVKFALTKLASIQTQAIQLICQPEKVDMAQVRQELNWLGDQVVEVEAG